MPGTENAPRIYFGDSEAAFVLLGAGTHPNLPIFDPLNLKVERFGTDVAVSLDLYDSSGHMSAQISQNEWKVNPNKLWDRNYSGDALEILGPDGKVALQIKLVEDGIRLQYRLNGPNGECFAFWRTSDPQHPGALAIASTAEQREQILEIKPMFKYPSKLHFGELASD